MFNKNLKFYRLRKEMTKKDLAATAGLSAMAITNYENGSRLPDMDTLKKLANALDVKVSDFLDVRNENLVFRHEEFRKASTLGAGKQEYIRECVEEYFNRFFTIVELLGGDVLPNPPECHTLQVAGDIEENASALRSHLGLAPEGPIDDLITILENKGILVFVCDVDNTKFSGMNGFVDNRPYIVINGCMTPERNRSTIVHELAHLMFDWPTTMDEKICEGIATAISGAFLFSKKDAIRELGIKRSKITPDMFLVCKEYGISMYMLVTRAKYVNVISETLAKEFYIHAGQKGWRTNEPSRIKPEQPTLFRQLVYRAIGEGDISIQRGAELLKLSYSEVASSYASDEDWTHEVYKQ